MSRISPAAQARGFAAGPRAESSDSAFIFQPKVVTRAFPSNVIAWRESRDRAQLSRSREEQEDLFIFCSLCSESLLWRSATQSAGGCDGGGEPSGATSVRRGQGGAKRRSRRSQGETDTGPWRSRAYSREATMSKCTSAAYGSRQGGRQREGARRPLAETVGPIVGLLIVERNRATWILREICYFVGSRRNGGWIGAMQGAG